MILVDTAVWIDHLHLSDSLLVELLQNDEVGCHPSVIEELALGSLKSRSSVIELLSNLRWFPELTYGELMHLIEVRRLWGRGLSAIDVHLLGSVALVEGAKLWTKDRRLRAACVEVGVGSLT